MQRSSCMHSSTGSKMRRCVRHFSRQVETAFPDGHDGIDHTLIIECFAGDDHIERRASTPPHNWHTSRGHKGVPPPAGREETRVRCVNPGSGGETRTRDLRITSASSENLPQSAESPEAMNRRNLESP